MYSRVGMGLCADLLSFVVVVAFFAVAAVGLIS